MNITGCYHWFVNIVRVDVGWFVSIVHVDVCGFVSIVRVDVGCMDDKPLILGCNDTGGRNVDVGCVSVGG